MMANSLRELAMRWRAQAGELRAYAPGAAAAFNRCAEELERELRSQRRAGQAQRAEINADRKRRGKLSLEVYTREMIRARLDAELYAEKNRGKRFKRSLEAYTQEMIWDQMNAAKKRGERSLDTYTKETIRSKDQGAMVMARIYPRGQQGRQDEQFAEISAEIGPQRMQHARSASALTKTDPLLLTGSDPSGAQLVLAVVVLVLVMVAVVDAVFPFA